MLQRHDAKLQLLGVYQIRSVSKAAWGGGEHTEARNREALSLYASDILLSSADVPLKPNTDNELSFIIWIHPIAAATGTVTVTYATESQIPHFLTLICTLAIWVS